MVEKFQSEADPRSPPRLGFLNHTSMHAITSILRYRFRSLERFSHSTVRSIFSESTLSLQGITATTDGHKRWTHSPAEFDFRSDTVTTPTSAMLKSLDTASFGDDVFKESSTTCELESYIASLFNKPAALFATSGTLANSVSLLSLLSGHQPAVPPPPHSILCDSRAHIFLYEAGGASRLTGAQLVPITPKNGLYLTVNDVSEHTVLTEPEDVHSAPTAIIALENTINGVIHPLAEVQRIAAFARENHIAIHLDGARLWNAVEAGAGTLEEYAREADTLTVCASKSLGAPMGSFVVGPSERLVRRATHWRKMLGGGMRQAGVVAAMARVAVDEVFLKGRLKEADQYAKILADVWTNSPECAGSLIYPADTNMVWLDLKGRGVDDKLWVDVAKTAGVKVAEGGRVVCHYQNSTMAVQRLVWAVKEVCRLTDQEGRRAVRAARGLRTCKP